MQIQSTNNTNTKTYTKNAIASLVCMSQSIISKYFYTPIVVNDEKQKTHIRSQRTSAF